MRIELRTVLFAVLLGVAIAYFALPGRAAESCRTWVADMQEDEGGPVLTAHACSDDASETALALRCFRGTIWIEHDLAVGSDREPNSEETVAVEFVTDSGTQTVSMRFQEMNAMFGGEIPADGPLMSLLKSSESVLLRDSGALYPARTYSLRGSSAALSTLVSRCN